MSESEPTKICRKCDQEKSLSCFSKHSDTKDGLDNRCKECVKIAKQKSKEIPQKLHSIRPFDTESKEWQVGKPMGTIFYREKEKFWQAIIKIDGKQKSKVFRGDDAEKNGDDWLFEMSNKFGLTKNRIRMKEKGVIEVELTKDKTMITDLENLDICQQYMVCSKKSGRENADYYCTVTKKPGMIGFHNFITGFKMVDHINRNPLDNRKINLREANPKINNNNQKTPSTNSSGHMGVRFINDREEGSWQARIKQDGKEYGKTFSVKEYGYEVAKKMAIEYRKFLNKDFSCTNGELI